MLGQDATQQMAAGLAAYGKSDMNYTGQAFLGYPVDYTEYFYPEANIYLCENEDELPADMNVDLQTVVYAVEGLTPNSLTDHIDKIENDILEIDDRAQMTLQRLIY